MVSIFLVITSRFLISSIGQFKIPIVGVNVTAKVLCAIDLFVPFNSDLHILFTILLYSFVTRSLLHVCMYVCNCHP